MKCFIKGKRELMGISQADLARKTGIAREQISRIENNKIKPGIEICKKIADALMIPIDMLWK